MEYWGLETKELPRNQSRCRGGGRGLWFSNILQWYLISLESLAGSISGQWYLHYFLLFCHRVLICPFFSYHLPHVLCLSCCIFSTNPIHARPFTNTGPTIYLATWPFFFFLLFFHLRMLCHSTSILTARKGLIMLRPKCTFAIKSLLIPEVSRRKNHPLGCSRFPTTQFY